MKRVSILTLAVAGAVAAAVSGYDNSQAAEKQKGLPHGGTGVVVREHRLNLELVPDPAAGLCRAYLYDDAFAKPVAVAETNFTMLARVGGREERADFVRVPDKGNGGTKESSVFEARAEWIKTASKFEGLIPTATFKGRTYRNIKFPFPEGTQHDH
jgi:hypothetical protein